MCIFVALLLLSPSAIRTKQTWHLLHRMKPECESAAIRKWLSPWLAAWARSAAWWGSAYVHSSLEGGRLIECCVSLQGHVPPPGSSHGDVMEPAWLQCLDLERSVHNVKRSLQLCSQLYNTLHSHRNKPHAMALFTYPSFCYNSHTNHLDFLFIETLAAW
jgi:hypothetical protein